MIITAMSVTMTAFAASAQTMYDGLLFSQNNYVGTARTMAMGNAFTALGGDPGSFVLNPAGSAVSSKVQISVTGGFATTVSIAQGTSMDGSTINGFGNRTKTNMSKFILPNFALMASYDTKGSSVKRFSLGISANTTDLYFDNTYASGNHYGTTFAGYLAANTNAPYAELIDKNAYSSGYAWDAVMGVQSGMISTVSGSDSRYVGATEKYVDNGDGTYSFYPGGTLEQDYGRLTKGQKNDIVFNAGLDISDWIYIGVNLGVQYINYSYDWYLRETAQDPSDFELEFNDNGSTVTTYFNDLKYQYWYKAKGTGIYGKFGILMTPGKHLRIGAAIQTPTAVTIKEHYGISGSTNFQNSKFSSSSTSPDGEWGYSLRSPFRASLGLAATLGKVAAISADYEVAAFGSNMRFGNRTSAEDVFSDVNTDIRECMGAQHNLRLGAEVKFASLFAARAGYALQSSPIRKELDVFGNLNEAGKGLSHCASVGFGFAKNSFYADIAARSLFYPDEYILPYSHYVTSDDAVIAASPEIRNWKAMINGVLTIGFRF